MNIGMITGRYMEMTLDAGVYGKRRDSLTGMNCMCITGRSGDIVVELAGIPDA